MKRYITEIQHMKIMMTLLKVIATIPWVLLFWNLFPDYLLMGIFVLRNICNQYFRNSEDNIDTYDILIAEVASCLKL